MLDRITPVVLTYNEAPNIAACLGALAWSREVVVVDSFSDDGTPEIVRRFANARLLQRRFDTHTRQWDFAIRETGVSTEWVLRLDADYVVTPALVDELAALVPPEEVAGYEVPFVYCIAGRPLRANLYRPGIRLLRPERCRIVETGQGDRVLPAAGRVAVLAGPMLHDDRKPLDRFVATQMRYMRLEAAKLRGSNRRDLDAVDRVRCLRVIAPLLIIPYCLFVKGLVLDGRAGWFYTVQRFVAEALLSLHLLAADIGIDAVPAGDGDPPGGG